MIDRMRLANDDFCYHPIINNMAYSSKIINLFIFGFILSSFPLFRAQIYIYIYIKRSLKGQQTR